MKITLGITMNSSIRRWTAKRSTALFINMIKGMTTMAKASRRSDVLAFDIKDRIEDAKRGMENSLHANLLDIREQLNTP
jgi:hypothetical protein